MKRVLALYYSQTGQLGRSLESLLAGLDPQVFDVHVEPLRAAFPFPWSAGRFFGAFPESVVGDPPPIEPPGFEPDAEFDLVILGYTVWFLSPSLPVQAFFRSPHARVLQGRPVITLIACRNMWHTASERMKRMVAEAGGRLIDNVVVTDQGPAWATFVTTPRWMFTGRSDAFWFFPPAGVAGTEIVQLGRFGEALSRRIPAAGEVPEGPLLTGLDAVRVDARFVLAERIGAVVFRAWAHLIRGAGRLGAWARRLALAAFVVCLPFTILIVVPASALLRVVFSPFLRGWLESYTDRLLAPSSSLREQEQHAGSP